MEKETRSEGVGLMRGKAWLIVLFLTGFIILIYPHVAQYVNSEIQKDEAEQFKRQKHTLSSDYIAEMLLTAQECNESIYTNEGSFQDPFTEEYEQVRYDRCKEIINEGDYFAAIEIPKLHLDIPIYLGASENELSQGIGQVDGSSLPIGGASTHTVLAGHRGMGVKAMFRNLDRLKESDLFYIHTLEGKLTYRVIDVEVILPHETDNLRIREGEDLASLITCHPYRSNSHRLVVHGERVIEK